KRLLEVLFKDGQFQWQRLENLVTIARSDESFDWFPTAQLGLQHLFSEEGGYLRHLLLMALTEGDRLHTEEVQRLWDLVKDDIPPVRLLNTALGSLAEFSIGSAAALFPSVANLSRFVS
ncbi:MAG: AarF/ABC1/UbiB kinase family protein, partial [Synechococcales cyanobacterium]